MLSELFDLSGKTAIVTGASYGLGVTFAETLAAAGAQVVVSARSVEKLEEVAQRVGCVAIACDVTNAAQVSALVESVWQRFGRVDILVNNAGIAAEGGLMPENVPAEMFERTLSVNVTGVYNCCREVGSRMLADGKGGSIINIASIAGLLGQADMPVAYQASKAAVINMTRTLACSWGNRGVRVNAIAPGWFPSEMTAGVFSLPGFREWAEKGAPLGRIGDPGELAGPLLFLASAASSFVTGHTLAVDGGTSAAMGHSPFPDAYYEIMAHAVPNGLGKRISSNP